MSCRTEGIQEIGDSRADPNDRPPKPVEMVGVLVFAQAIKKRHWHHGQGSRLCHQTIESDSIFLNVS